MANGVGIHFRKGGDGPPLLLLHGYPESHVMWHKIAPQLAQKFTVVASDLRGYGDSNKPPSGDENVGYSKRTLAQDQVELMAGLGFEEFLSGRPRPGLTGRSPHGPGSPRTRAPGDHAGHHSC